MLQRNYRLVILQTVSRNGENPEGSE